jgi:SpoVK/Ycf46/Vps4 family AAA+-type ATPase
MDSKCAVLFFDEIDALGQSRSGISASHPEQSSGADPCSRRVLAELLIQLNRINSSNDNKKDNQDSFQSVENGSTSLDTETVDTTYENEPFSDSAEGNTGLRVRVIVVAATNRPEDCDPALVRRFSVRVMVGLPLQRDRKKILNRYLTDIENSISSEQLDDLALATEGWSGSDLESLTREAAMAPVRECIRSAALLKRRTPQREQRGGDSSGQNDDFTGSAIREKARENLLEQFRTLRTVSMEDFKEAIAFWTGNHCNGDSNTQSGDQPGMTRRMIHYDSSSDEED